VIVSASALTNDGAGMAILSGTNTCTGCTTVLEGTLIVESKNALEDGSDLSIGSDVSSFTPVAAVVPDAVASNAASVTVPEPRTFVLLAAAAIGLLGYGQQRRMGQRR
jgi:autotransporter-associated beta strand protein